MYAELRSESEINLNRNFQSRLSLVPVQPKLKIHDIMSIEEIKIYEDDQVNNILRIMEWEGLKHVCVFSQQNTLIGILNFDDVKNQKNSKKLARDIMNKKFHKIYGALDSEIGKNEIVKEEDHCMPVFENKEIIGILTLENVFPYNEFN